METSPLCLGPSLSPDTGSGGQGVGSESPVPLIIRKSDSVPKQKRSQFSNAGAQRPRERGKYAGPPWGQLSSEQSCQEQAGGGTAAGCECGGVREWGTGCQMGV